jgi:hypothetical protein
MVSTSYLTVTDILDQQLIASNRMRSTNTKRPRTQSFIPSQCISYLRTLSDPQSEKFYTGVASDPKFKVKLTGSWETVVGEQDTFGNDSGMRLLIGDILTRSLQVHILEYENYRGYDHSTALIRDSPVRPLSPSPPPSVTCRPESPWD